MTDEAPSVADSILNSVKKLLGLDAADTSFDVDVTIHINSAFSTLFQLGVGPTTEYSIADQNNVWSEFIGITTPTLSLNAVKTYVYLKVRLVFDTPATSFVIDAITAQMKEIEWRLNVEQENINDLTPPTDTPSPDFRTFYTRRPVVEAPKP